MFALGLCAVAVLAAVAVEAESLVPVAVLLHVAALSGIAFIWLRMEASAQEARKASAGIAVLAGRLDRLEQQLRLPGATANPALRTTMAEVTGTVGLLGGVVRELAKNVAAQHRDVADLKSNLQHSRKTRNDEQSALRIAPEPRLAEHRSLDRPSAQPEPSLLPLPQRGMEDDDMHRARLISQAFEADRIELHLQPVVALPQRKVRFYEALARLQLEDGTIIGPAEFLPHLERLGRAPDFDRRVVGQAIAIARHLVARGSEAIVTVNLSPRSLMVPGFLWSLVRLLEAAPEITGKVVLELPQQGWRMLDAEQREAVLALRDRGVPLSLDQASDMGFDARMLAEYGIRFVKFTADMILAEAERDEGREIGVRDFASLLRRAGIKLVAERVEREEMVPALIELGVPLAQGFVFAAPRAVRAEVLAAADSKKAVPAEGTRSAIRRAG
ncbi:EAL domain-containing protein [Microvirga sp. 2TAF3]|uniref:EAL domain-containing protein n=1 Tax=Microvirga sp. 2TAF3 TaxID=3233014 RepID=UPI003F95E9C5